MKKKLLPFLLMLIVVILTGCVGDDIDKLQSQIDELNSKVDDLEKTQQDALLTQIANLQAAMAQLEASLSNNIEAGDADLQAKYDAMAANLALLQDEVTNNVSAVFYGNLLTDDDFAAFSTKGATIVTGKVIAKTQAHIDALANAKMVGGSLTIAGGTSVELSALQNVGGSLMVSGVSSVGAAINLPVLASIGDGLSISNNSQLVSFTADALVLINANLESMANPMMETLSLKSLDQAAAVKIDEFIPDDPNYTGLGSLTTLDLSSTNVINEVEIKYVSGGALKLGMVGASVNISYTKLEELVINTEVIKGDFTLMYNGNLTTINVSAIKEIQGAVNLSFNSTGWFDYIEPKGLSSLPAFEALETVGGDVRIEGNEYLTSLETFNSVTTFTGTQIFISSNGNSGTGLALINVFNALPDGGPSAWNKLDLYVWQNSSWFNGFNALVEAKDITLVVNGIMDQNTWTNGPTKIEGFAAMTACKSLVLNATDAETFTAFASLNNFKGFGVEHCLTLDMPKAMDVGLCSMATILNKIKNGDFDSKPAVFKQNWMEVDKETAVSQLLATCAGN